MQKPAELFEELESDELLQLYGDDDDDGLRAMRADEINMNMEAD